MTPFGRAGKFSCQIFIAIGVLLLHGVFAHGAETKKLTLGYSTLGPAGTGLWMAKEIGAFEKYGIDADLIFISAGPLVVQALLGGDLQAGLAATNAVVAAHRKGHTSWTAPYSRFSLHERSKGSLPLRGEG